MLEDVQSSPVVQRLKRVALALGDLRNDVVFIGGSIVPLLQIDSPFEAPRATLDVDGILAKAIDGAVLDGRLRSVGFRRFEDTRHRWISEGGDAFDLLDDGGNDLEGVAIATSAQTNLGDGVLIRHFDAPAFIAIKFAVFGDRGLDDPYTSHDVQDILRVVASRSEIAQEVASSWPMVRSRTVSEVSQIMSGSGVEDLLAEHLQGAQDPQRTMREVRERLAAIASLKA